MDWQVRQNLFGSILRHSSSSTLKFAEEPHPVDVDYPEDSPYVTSQVVYLKEVEVLSILTICLVTFK